MHGGGGEERVVGEGGDIHAYILRVIGTLMCFRSSAVYWLKLPVSFLALALLTSSDSCFLGVSLSLLLLVCVVRERIRTVQLSKLPALQVSLARRPWQNNAIVLPEASESVRKVRCEVKPGN